MNVSLTQKERMLLEEEKTNEELCVQKYMNYANQTNDAELKQMFTKHAGQEQAHTNILNQILNGQVPDLNTQPAEIPVSPNIAPAGMCNQSDKSMCQDLLGTEKYVSSTYNSTIFECTDSNVRSVLNHIQKDEQKHGEEIFKYMDKHGMYKVQ